MNLPTQSQVYAFGRHLASYAGGAITAAAAFNLLSPGQAGTLNQSLNHFINGVSEIAAAVSPLIPLVTGWLAARSASPKAQLAAVAQIPGTTVVTQPQLAAAVPATNVISNDTSKVTPK